MRLGVAIPMFNEAASIRPTLDALIAQSDRDFFVVFCDNASTDGSAEVVRNHLGESGLEFEVVVEKQKGTGAAADTAVRRVIELGATHIARTDADCLPRADWVARIKETFAQTDLVMLAGYTPVRTDEFPVSLARRAVLRVAFDAARLFGMFRPSNYGDGLKGRYVMSSGNNLAIQAETYVEVGGFPRTKIEDVHEDRGLVLRVRRLTPKIGYRKDIVVFASARRLQAWGLRNTLKWYANHSYRPAHVDIRLSDGKNE